jgi:hypothetical protein
VRAQAVGVVAFDAVELAAGARTIVVDRAAIIVAEELAAAVDVRKDALVGKAVIAVAGNGDVDGVGRNFRISSSCNRAA